MFSFNIENTLWLELYVADIVMDWPDVEYVLRSGIK